MENKKPEEQRSFPSHDGRGKFRYSKEDGIVFTAPASYVDKLKERLSLRSLGGPKTND